MTMRATGLTIAALALGGCCGSERISDTGYASMMVYGPQITACIVDGDCQPLCADKFGLDETVEIVRCEITSIDRQAPGASSSASIHRDPVLTRAVERAAPAQGSTSAVEPHAALASSPGSLGTAGTADAAGTADDLSLVVGVRVRVTYVAPAACEFGVGFGAGDDGWSDDSGDDGSTDDGSDDYPDDGSDDYPDDYPDDDSDDYPDDGGGDDGTDDGDTGDDGGGDDGGGDDGGGDDGGGDDGGGDDGGWGGTIRGGGARSMHQHAAASDHRPAATAGRIVGEQPSKRAR